MLPTSSNAILELLFYEAGNPYLEPLAVFSELFELDDDHLPR